MIETEKMLVMRRDGQPLSESDERCVAAFALLHQMHTLFADTKTAALAKDNAVLIELFKVTSKLAREYTMNDTLTVGIAEVQDRLGLIILPDNAEGKDAN
jgi:hypothetical protein